MFKRMTIYTICVLLCVLCCLGCNHADVPAGTEEGQSSAPASTENHQGNQNMSAETEEAGESVTEPAGSQNPESQVPETETKAPTAGNENDQQINDTQAPDDGKVTYEAYNAMSAEEQQAFYLSFSDPQDFFDWYNAAKEEHDKNDGSIIIGEDSVIDLEDLLGGNAG